VYRRSAEQKGQYQEAPDRLLEGLAAMYLLEVLSGPLDGKTWPFDREITIGRDDAVAEACIALDRYVSRKHARVRIDEGSALLTDLQSRNGTKLNGQPVVGDAPLPIGVPFIVGRTVLRVTRV
jgi:pSer/pThr/pTyr-binding forkhead associated (FHA) protein